MGGNIAAKNSPDIDWRIEAPTRVTATSESILNLIMVSDKDQIIQSGVLDIGLSDHVIVHCTRKIKKIHINKHNTVYIRSIRKHSKETFIKLLSDVNWMQVEMCDVFPQ